MSLDLSMLMSMGTMLVGAVAAYYGARNAMQERLARLETNHTNMSTQLVELTRRVDDAHARINRIIEK